MLGAIIGDIAGSRFERRPYKKKDFELFTKDCRVTDDSITTIAVAKAMMETEKAIGSREKNGEYYRLLEKLTVQYLQEYGRKYPDSGFGGMFYQWIFSSHPKPYNSFGNGAAMRISPAGFAANTEKEALRLSDVITGVTHNHEEGLKGAKATAVAIYMARNGAVKEEIRAKISREYYPLDFTLDEIRGTYKFYVTCQETVPQAIVSFLESDSFEDAIRNAISLGGDSDTLGAITGSIAEAFYGVPGELKEKAFSYLNQELVSVVHEWETLLQKRKSAK